MSSAQVLGVVLAGAFTFGLTLSGGVAFVLVVALNYQDFMQRKRMEEAKKEALKMSSDLRDELLAMKADAVLASGFKAH